jgi:predicted permease
MSWLRAAVARCRALVRRKSLEESLNEELGAHMQMLIEENLGRGMPPDEARHAAPRSLGDVESMKEAYREQRGLPMMETLLQDIRYGLRMLARRPSFTALVVLTLGLGIGAATATFSIVDAVLLRPLPYRQPDRLVAVWGARVGHIGTSKNFDSYPEFQEWKRSNHSFEQLEALTWAFAGQTMSWRGKPQRVLAIPVTQGFFSLLGVHAAQGRTFEPEDLKAGCAVVLSHRFWQERLGAPAAAVGANLGLDGKACTVVGIMSRGFDFYPRQSDLWTLITPETDNLPNPYDYIVAVVGRLKQGVSPARAQAELTVIHQGLIPQLPPQAWIYQLTPVVYDLQSEFTWLAGRNLRTGLLVLLAAVTVVLLIACLNVANLLLGRAGERERELAIRAALGCGRRRLVRQLLTESLLLALLGAALGIVLTVAGVAYFRAANPVELPPGNVVTVNGQVLAFTIVVAILTGVLFGLFPAWKASRPDLDEVMKQSGRGVARNLLSQRGAKLLVVMETALSLVLLAAAGLLIQSIARFGSAPLGFNPDHLLTAQIDLPKAGYSELHARMNFYRTLISNLRALPRIQGVALSTWLPLGGGGNEALAVKGRPAPPNGAGDLAVDKVSADLFRVADIPLLQGREFDARDHADSQPVAIVNQALVKEYFPHEDPLGREIRVVEDSGKGPWVTIVGVVGDIKRTTVYQEMGYIVPPAIYRPLDQLIYPRGGRGGMAPASVGIILRAAGEPMALRPAVERTVSGLDKDVPVSDFKSANDRISEFFGQPRFRTVVLGAFAGLALLLAGIGLYGVMSQSASQRRHEIGIRMALGAERRHVLWLVVSQGMGLGVAGVGIGLVAALALTRVLIGMLYGVKPVDPVTLFAVTLLMIVVAGLASYIPARRATKVDPMVALRYE